MSLFPELRKGSPVTVSLSGCLRRCLPQRHMLGAQDPTHTHTGATGPQRVNAIVWKPPRSPGSLETPNPAWWARDAPGVAAAGGKGPWWQVLGWPQGRPSPTLTPAWSLLWDRREGDAGTQGPQGSHCGGQSVPSGVGQPQSQAGSQGGGDLGKIGGTAGARRQLGQAPRVNGGWTRASVSHPHALLCAHRALPRALRGWAEGSRRGQGRPCDTGQAETSHCPWPFPVGRSRWWGWG